MTREVAMGEMSPEQREAIAESIKVVECVASRMRAVELSDDVSPGIFGGSDGGRRLAAAVNQANEHLREWTAEKVEEMERTLDEMYTEAARLQAADRAAAEGEER